jgi:CoA:oxalate CoA-transferase
VSIGRSIIQPRSRASHLQPWVGLLAQDKEIPNVANVEPQRPLAGLTVVDLTRALAGPFSTLMLAGLGARVIKIEDPRGGDARDAAPYLGRDGISLRRKYDDDMPFSNLIRLRGKLGVTLNFKHPEAQSIFGDLVRGADIVVENFSAGTAERLGLGYTYARSVNPRIIYCSISGFGQGNAGKAMDTVIQALSGMMLVSGEESDPPIRIGVPTADVLTPLYAVIGILSALEQRHRTGVGQLVDVSMLGTMTSFLAVEPVTVLERLGIPARTGPTVPRLVPFGAYPASDGWVVICASGYKLLPAFAPAIGHPEILEDPRFNTQEARIHNYKELDEIIGSWTSQFTAEEAVGLLDKQGVAAAVVRAPAEGMMDPRVLQRGEVERLKHPTYGVVDEAYGPGLPITFSDAVANHDQPPPWLGEHNDQIYGEELGYSPERLVKLRDEGAI